MNAVSEKIRHAIVSEGGITFARFMELALYCPLYGYYEQKKDSIGRAGDFYTNLSVGSLFGELLAFQFAHWFSEPSHVDWLTAKRGPIRLVEAGAHDGRLAADILPWLRKQRPAFFDDLEYWIVEPSRQRQAWQKETLRDFEARVVWCDSLISLPPEGVCGAIFCNELLDSMPVHRLGWDAGLRDWFEWGVSLRDNEFVWTRMPKATAKNGNSEACLDWPDVPTELLAVLPDGYTIEMCPLAVNWWRQAAHALRCGKLLTMDYGLTAQELFAPERKNGTLRAYQRHRVSNRLLLNPGEQDITAHVNLTALQIAGESASLKTESLCSQARFLTAIAERTWNENGAFGRWTPSHARQFQTLTHPDHLGRRFQLLLQSR